MCGVAAIYGMSVNEVLKLSEPQIQYMLDQAGKAAESLVQENANYKRAVTGQVLATRRAVTSALGSEFSDVHMRMGACSAEFAMQKLFFTSPTFAAELRTKLAPVLRDAELTTWPQNGLRHSFGSYHLAKFGNANALALEMGHTTTKEIFAHYRELVRPDEAERYWNIKPAAEAGVVPMEAAAS